MVWRRGHRPDEGAMTPAARPVSWCSPRATRFRRPWRPRGPRSSAPRGSTRRSPCRGLRARGADADLAERHTSEELRGEQRRDDEDEQRYAHDAEHERRDGEAAGATVGHRCAGLAVGLVRVRGSCTVGLVRSRGRRRRRLAIAGGRGRRGGRQRHDGCRRCRERLVPALARGGRRRGRRRAHRGEVSHRVGSGRRCDGGVDPGAELFDERSDLGRQVSGSAAIEGVLGAGGVVEEPEPDDGGEALSIGVRRVEPSPIDDLRRGGPSGDELLALHPRTHGVEHDDPAEIGGGLDVGGIERDDPLEQLE